MLSIVKHFSSSRPSAFLSSFNFEPFLFSHCAMSGFGAKTFLTFELVVPTVVAEFYT